MSEHDLRGAGAFLLALLVAALVSGIAWRAPGPGPEPGEQGDRTAGGRPTVRLLVPPDWRAEQIAQALDAAGAANGDRFLELVRHPRRLRLGGRWNQIPSLEGYLSPGAYELADDRPEERLLRSMTQAFERRMTPVMRRRAAELGLSLHELVTLASIVEREVDLDSEAPVVAGVFANRLRRRMPLASDTTLIYALDTMARRKGALTYWVTPLRRRDLLLDSPYNTHMRAGLPPGPIASPSLEALKAVLWPAPVDYLFFAAKLDGTHAFARTFREHEANVDRFLRQRERRSRAPSHLQRVVETVMRPVEGHVGVVVKDLATGETASLNADEYFSSASLYKLLVLIAAFERRQRGTLSFAERISIRPAILGRDSSAIQERLGPRPTVRNALEQMIVVSSNAAGVTLREWIGRRMVERVVRRYGARDTWLSRARTVTTPRDIAHLLELLARQRLVSRKASREMLRILLRQELNDRLPRYLPKVRIAHKTGSAGYPSHDAGILYGRRGRFVVVVMTEHAEIPAVATASIGRLAKVVFNYFEHYPPAARRFAAGGYRTCPSNPFGPRARGPLAGKTIVLDPGHGGRRSPGASFRFRDGSVLLEKDAALAVGLRLKELLVRRGATVWMTRCSDVYLPVSARAAFANSHDPNLFISLHLNALDDPHHDGTRVYAFSASGTRLANYLQGSFMQPALWATLNARLPLPNRGVGQAHFAVLAYAQPPAALTESVYLTNPAEARAVRASWRLDEIARGHLKGILNYFAAGKPAARPRAAVHQQPGRVGPPGDALERLRALGAAVRCGGGHRRLVALTFDDGPSRHTAELLRLLRAAGARATFFVVGTRVGRRPKTLREEAKLGAVGDHSWEHGDLSRRAFYEVDGELRWTQLLLGGVLGRRVKLFRPPYGRRSAAVDQAVDAHGMVQVLWSVDSGDSRRGATVASVLRSAADGLRPGAIILFHDTSARTVEAVRGLLPVLRARRLRPVSVPELLELDPPSPLDSRGCLSFAAD